MLGLSGSGRHQTGGGLTARILESGYPCRLVCAGWMRRSRVASIFCHVGALTPAYASQSVAHGFESRTVERETLATQRCENLYERNESYARNQANQRSLIFGRWCGLFRDTQPCPLSGGCEAALYGRYAAQSSRSLAAAIEAGVGQFFRFLNREVAPICEVTGGTATPTLTPAPESAETGGLR